MHRQWRGGEVTSPSYSPKPESSPHRRKSRQGQSYSQVQAKEPTESKLESKTRWSVGRGEGTDREKRRRSKTRAGDCHTQRWKTTGSDDVNGSQGIMGKKSGCALVQWREAPQPEAEVVAPPSASGLRLRRSPNTNSSNCSTTARSHKDSVTTWVKSTSTSTTAPILTNKPLTNHCERFWWVFLQVYILNE